MLDAMNIAVRGAVTPFEFKGICYRKSGLSLVNSLAQASPSLVVKGQGIDVRARFASAFPCDVQAVLRVTLLYGSDFIDAYFTEDFAATLCARAGCDVHKVADDPCTISIVLEHFLSEPLAQLESAKGFECNVDSVDLVSVQLDVGNWVAFELEGLPFNDSPSWMFLSHETVKEHFLEALTGPLAAAPTCATLSSLVMELRHLSAPVAFPKDELGLYCVGDVMLVPENWLSGGAGIVLVNDTFGARLESGQDKAVLGGTLQSIGEINSTFYQEFEGMTHEYEANSFDIADLPILLSVELERAEVTVTELQGLTVGSVLPFKGGTPETLKLYANGRYFGSGKLVRIDDEIGVQLDALA